MPTFSHLMPSRLITWPVAIGLAAFLIRRYVQSGQFEKETDETGKVVIVTGSNMGIGKETVLELARRGATVYMACRNKSKTEQALKEIIEQTGNNKIFFRELDLSSLKSVRKFVSNFKEEQDELHILINNAGVILETRGLTEDGFEMQLGVNHMGHFLLTILLLDLLKKSAPSRIINVSSLAHTNGEIKVDDLNSEKNYQGGKAYSQSKLANVMFTRELAKRLEGTGVSVNALHPGMVNTEIAKNFILAQTKLVRLFAKLLFMLFTQDAKSGAQTTLYAALDPDLDGVTGQYFSDCKPKKVGHAATDEKVSQFLWEESMKWTGAPKVI
ncbi:retinol dehydrogenase 12-like [Drosophila grimshawi]|uniref:retinol dehydrogenase 12-like n=1 Tax=Drosophila grimshawi TaxID=7222 RepID=UPI000C86FD61|nr:retinol dehydrogenase 12-like [Drosophila grimshawi]